MGLLALLLLTDGRRAARTDEHGELVLLEDQDRGRWDQGMIVEGEAVLQSALRRGRSGPYQLYAELIRYEPTRSCRPTGRSRWPWLRARPPDWSSSMPSPITLSCGGGPSFTSPGPN